MKKHNFSAGPSILPENVIKQAAQTVIELDDIGLLHFRVIWKVQH